VRRFVTQSFAPYRYAREGGPVKTEDEPLDPTPPANAKQSWAAPITMGTAKNSTTVPTITRRTSHPGAEGYPCRGR
jgi:hypothetical protein